MNFTTTSLGTVCKITTGKRPNTKVSAATNEMNIPVYGGNGVAWYTNETLITPHVPIVLTGRVGTLGTFYQVNKPCWVSDNALIIMPEKVCPDFIFYYMKLIKLDNLNRGSTQPLLTQTDLKQIQITIPSELHDQIKIASVLKMLDSKIEQNTAINNNLEQQAQALFKSWFVDFEHCESEPFKDSEIGKIPNSYKVYHLKDFLPVITGKKNANVSSNKGKYPFFSCSQTIAWTDDYSFDGDAILVAGNGDFNVKFYKGKFEAYQRTYVLIPYEQKYTAWLYYAVKHNLHNITSAARGSVISFITKGNLEDFAFAAPEDLTSAPVIETFASINKIIDANTRENYKLAAIRDALLPKLMSGEIDVSKVDISDPSCLDKSLFDCVEE